MTAEFHDRVEVYTLDNNIFTGHYSGDFAGGVTLTGVRDKINNTFYASINLAGIVVVKIVQLEKCKPKMPGETLI